MYCKINILFYIGKLFRAKNIINISHTNNTSRIFLNFAVKDRTA